MALKNILQTIDISASGLSAMRRKMNAIASNIANSETTRTDEGGPYKRKIVVMDEGQNRGFLSLMKRAFGGLRMTDNAHMESKVSKRFDDRRISGVDTEMVISDEEPVKVFDPKHPDADPEGYVSMPNINIVEEMVDMIMVSRAYEANLAAMNADKAMTKQALDI